VKDSVREAAAAFACQIGSLSDDPALRDTLLKTAVREVSWRLLDEFGDHCALAEQLQIMSELAWRGADAFWAAGIAIPLPTQDREPQPANGQILWSPPIVCRSRRSWSRCSRSGSERDDAKWLPRSVRKETT
jgi:hypothetical protein